MIKLLCVIYNESDRARHDLECYLVEINALSVYVDNGGTVTFNLHLFAAVRDEYVFKSGGIYVFAALVFAYQPDNLEFGHLAYHYKIQQTVRRVGHWRTVIAAAVILP